MRTLRVLAGWLSGCLIGCGSTAWAAAVDFGTVELGKRSTERVTITIPYATRLGRIVVRTEGVESLDFADTGKGSCRTTRLYSAGGFCTVRVSFSPGYAGPRYGAVVVADTKGRVMATEYLSGTGVGSQAGIAQEMQRSITGFKSPDGIAVDAAGNVYVADYNASKVYKETPLPSGDYYRTLVAGSFTPVRVVAVDGGGNVFFDGLSGVAKETLQPSGRFQESAVGGFMGAPGGLAVDAAGNVYVSDSNFGKLYKHTFLPDGSYTRTVIRDELHGALGVAVDGSGNVYVAGQVDRKIYKETLSGESYIESSIDGPFTAPQGVAVDGNGNVYVSDFGTGEVYKETLKDGSYVQSVVASGMGAGYVAVDRAGSLYVSDVNEGKVMKLPIEGSPIPPVN